MSKPQIVSVEVVDNNVYVDMQICNTSTKEINLNFLEQFQNSIIDEPDRYKLAIVRWSVDSNLPLTAPYPQLFPNTDPNKLIYSFSMVYKTYVYQQYVTFISQNKKVSPPTILNNNALENPYYWLYDASSFINLLNTALVDCWNGLNALVISGGDSLNNNECNAYFEMNPVTYIINLCCDSTQYDLINNPNPIKLYMNTATHGYLKSFSNLMYNGYENDNGLDIQFNITLYNNLNIFTNNNVTYLMTYSEYSPVGSWNITSSVCITGSLPIVTTITALPHVIDSSAFSFVPSNNTERQLSDFVMDGDNYNTTGKILYLPQIYRYVNLMGSKSIDNIQLNFWFKTKLGNLFNFTLDSGSNATIKLLFEQIK